MAGVMVIGALLTFLDELATYAADLSLARTLNRKNVSVANLADHHKLFHTCRRQASSFCVDYWAFMVYNF
jgi:hypothetical protein